MKIYTRTGDQGETGLLGGPRVRKDHLRIAAYGDVDELNAALGQVVCEEPPARVRQVVCEIQHELFALGAELAAPDPDAYQVRWIGERHIARLEAEIDYWDARMPALREFILPGGSGPAAALHVARCVCRRAERQLVTLMGSDATVGPTPLTYLNRLSDLLFVLARAANHELGVADIPWQKPAD